MRGLLECAITSLVKFSEDGSDAPQLRFPETDDCAVSRVALISQRLGLADAERALLVSGRRFEVFHSLKAFCEASLPPGGWCCLVVADWCLWDDRVAALVGGLERVAAFGYVEGFGWPEGLRRVDGDELVAWLESLGHMVAVPEEGHTSEKATAIAVPALRDEAPPDPEPPGAELAAVRRRRPPVRALRSRRTSPAEVRPPDIERVLVQLALQIGLRRAQQLLDQVRAAAHAGSSTRA